MANWTNHLRQAQHNEALAAQMEANPDLQHWDWLITIAFYSAVHYVETAFFFIDGIVHTETACSDGDKHAFRANSVKDHFGRECWKSYRKLQIACYNVRYLGLALEQPAATAVQYYTRQDAARLFTTHLRRVRETVMARLGQ